MSNSPYPGIRPFTREETDIFFGREKQTDELIAKLGTTHFIAVVGTSGCGKSSLVRTGMIAGLETGFLATAGTRWKIAEMRPGTQPFENLADAFRANNDSSLSSELRGSLSLHELMRDKPENMLDWSWISSKNCSDTQISRISARKLLHLWHCCWQARSHTLSPMARFPTEFTSLSPCARIFWETAPGFRDWLRRSMPGCTSLPD
ncbi:MAG: hypothetical protein HC887_05130 [Desulfobacteraceae bacterium]|nr:hypothetical protein [Desulfobacteraceae bacterium]